MVKVLNKVLISLFLLLSLNNSAQNSVNVNTNRYNQWIQVGQTCYGCSSFYIMVVNDVAPRTDGLYYYSIFLWSNSFYNTGYVASTYVKNIKIYAKDISGTQTFLLKTDYALVPPKSDYFEGSYYLAYVYSGSAKQIIKITWDEIGIW